MYVYALTLVRHHFLIPTFRQRATETAKSIQNLASTGVVVAQAKVSTLSEAMVNELQKVQVRRILPTFFFNLTHMQSAGCDSCSSREPAGIVQTRAGQDFGHDF